MRKTHRERVDEHLSAEITLAVKSGDYTKAWKLTRTLASNFTGARRRKYRILRTSRPAAQQWADFFSQPGDQGGMSAHTVDVAQIKFDANNAPPFFFPVTRELKAQALADVKGIRLSLSLARKKKSLPELVSSSRIVVDLDVPQSNFKN